MRIPSQRRRRGYTIIEMMVVLGLLIILGAIIVPSFAGYYGNSKQRAAADVIRTRLAETRAKAMERGVPMRFAVNQTDGRIRVAPDGETFSSIPADNPPAFDSQATEDTLEGVTIEVILEADDDRHTPSVGGWTTVTTMKANGDSREPRHAIVSVKEKDFKPIQIEVRGLTGQVRTYQGSANGSQK